MTMFPAFPYLLTAIMAASPANTESAQPLPRVLIIGDSISIGYMEPLVDLLKDKAELLHNPGNAQSSAHGLAHLDEWIGTADWDIIHFNFGLHDFKYVDESGKNVPSKAQGHIQVSLDQYKQNMEAIVKRLKQTGASLIFATTTPVPKNVEGAVRDVEEAPRYNQAALEIVKAHDVAVNDLYAFALPRLTQIQLERNVHFSKEGYKALAEQVAAHINAKLDTLANAAAPAGQDQPATP